MSILAKLYDESIFSISEEGNNFQIMGACDHYHTVNLTAKEMLQLADEIRVLVEGKSNTKEG